MPILTGPSRDYYQRISWPVFARYRSVPGEDFGYPAVPDSAGPVQQYPVSPDPSGDERFHELSA